MEANRLIMPGTKRKRFNLYQAKQRIEDTGLSLPKLDECCKLFSPPGGWSSCALVLWIAGHTRIHSIRISTLRVGKKELIALCGIGVKDVGIVMGDIARQNKDKYDYQTFFEQVCDHQGFKYAYYRNHSKIILMDTEIGKLSIETSSNFNENPQMEQFSIENNEEVYNFYMEIFRDLL